eukprot:CAMPEP_0180036696 /NCGR_PEP_ID=MMETSP0984-20121128/31075_1 /TAXON_ID=483367 /ORGANISM="non described non described, Strain CCMP 2436" /LENGTH=65 /DNA_ID=CAMNT_0021962909 /DNA_START=74 /DNA_END=267 /DNA_ORIENTATION=-
MALNSPVHAEPLVVAWRVVVGAEAALTRLGRRHEPSGHVAKPAVYRRIAQPAHLGGSGAPVITSA